MNISKLKILEYINLIEKNAPKSDKPRKKSKSKKSSDTTVIKKSITESDFYQKAKEEKKVRERQLRMKLKEESKT